MQAPKPPAPTPTAQLMADRLAAYLGPHTARVAVKTFCQRSLGFGPELLAKEHVPALIEGLRPMLRSFVGRERSDAILGSIQREIGT